MAYVYFQGYGDAMLSLKSDETPARIMVLLDELYLHKRGEVLTDMMHEFCYHAVFDL